MRGVLSLVEGAMVLGGRRVQVLAVGDEHDDGERDGEDDADEDAYEQRSVVLRVVVVEVEAAHVVRAVVQVHNRLSPHRLRGVASAGKERLLAEQGFFLSCRESVIRFL